MPKENPTPLLEGLEYVSSGACPGCAECGLEDVEDGDTDAMSSANEGHFSCSSCDACGSSLGGQRHPAHGLTDTNTVLHLNVCVDCYNGFEEIEETA